MVIFAILSVVLIFFLGIFLVRKEIRLPYFFVSIGWWSFWFLVSLFTDTGFEPLADKTYLALAVFFLGSASGAAFGALYVKRKSHLTAECGDDQFREVILRKIFICVTAIACLIYLPTLVRAYQLMSSVGTETYKGFAFSLPIRTGLLFNSTLIESLYFFITGPLILVLSIVGIAMALIEKRILPLIIVAGLVFADSYIRLGRVGIYTFIVLLGVVVFVEVFLTRHRKFEFMKHKLRLGSLFLGACICLIYLIWAGGLRGFPIKDQFEIFVIDYHTIGFSLFDSELRRPDSVLNQRQTFGRLSIGGLESVATIFIRRFDRDYQSPALEDAIRLSNYVEIGRKGSFSEGFKGVKKYNSYYTMLYSFYSDFRWIGLFLGGAILSGLLAIREMQFQKSRSIFNSSVLILIVFIYIFSIFMSQLEIMRTWLVVLMLGMITVFARYRKAHGSNQ